MSAIEYRLPQERRIVTEFPGPRSAALAERRKKVVGAGVASTLPVYVADADGGVIVDVDGNSLIDLGAGIAVTSVGASNPAVVSAVQDQVAHFTHTRSEEHTSELQSLMRNSYAVFCLKNKKQQKKQ